MRCTQKYTRGSPLQRYRLAIWRSRNGGIAGAASVSRPRQRVVAWPHDRRTAGCKERRQGPRAAAGARQPARPGDRRDGHRQDRHAASARGAASRDRRAGVHGRREGRPRRRRRSRAATNAKVARAAASSSASQAPRSPPARSCSGTCSASEGIRSARPSRDLGPLLLGRLLDLNATQQGVLKLVFKIADDNGLLLLDLKDLRAMLQHVGDNAAQFTTSTATCPRQSIGAIQRGLLDARAAGRRPLLRRADARRRRPDPDRRRAGAAWSTCWPPTS